MLVTFTTTTDLPAGVAVAVVEGPTSTVVFIDRDASADDIAHALGDALTPTLVQHADADST